jgi:hypothetical protein
MNSKSLVLLVNICLHLLEQIQTSIKFFITRFEKQIQVLVWYLPSVQNEDLIMVFVRAYIPLDSL